MRTILVGIAILFTSLIHAQRSCGSTDYGKQQALLNPGLSERASQIESFISQQRLSAKTEEESGKTLRIPVVVHLLYSNGNENIPDEQIRSQIDALNRDFRRKNADSTQTPARFASLAADITIEFALATADPQGRPTNGIIRKQSSTTYWNTDDHIKFASYGGDDAWDSKSYLNIWIGNLRSLLGYASVLGGDPSRDGVVINYSAFGTVRTAAPYNLGRTTVHEVGHWLGLKHIWGDSYCGDDGVEDTPPQGNFTTGCPSSFRSSCNNGSKGDMYMNFMDYTDDACMNLFTGGQKERILALFKDGGYRNSLLQSRGLENPWTEGALPIPDAPLAAFSLYPNPTTGLVQIVFNEGDWTGSTLQVFDARGGLVMQTIVAGAATKLDLSRLKPGVYFLKSANSKTVVHSRFVKL